MTDKQTTDKDTIRQRHTELKRQDRDLRHAALQDVSKQTRPLFAALHAECGAGGHKWRFHHYNWDNTYAWDVCVWCGASEGADQHGGSAA